MGVTNLVGTRIDLWAAIESMLVPNSHSGTDFLAPEFGGPRSLHADRIQFLKKKSYGGGFVWELTILSTLRTFKYTIYN
jgi:hypothetical protein